MTLGLRSRWRPDVRKGVALGSRADFHLEAPRHLQRGAGIETRPAIAGRRGRFVTTFGWP
jgi:hypothetical protein